MSRIQTLLCAQALILIGSTAVLLDRDELGKQMQEMRPIVATAAALEVLGPDLEAQMS